MEGFHPHVAQLRVRGSCYLPRQCRRLKHSEYQVWAEYSLLFLRVWQASCRRKGTFASPYTLATRKSLLLAAAKYLL